MSQQFTISDDVLSNEDLLTLWYHGNQNAFGVLDQRVRGQLTRIALRRLPERVTSKVETAEDLVGDTMLKAMATRGRPSAQWRPDRGNVLNWLQAILRNLTSSFLRKRRDIPMSDLAAVYEEGEAQPFEAAIQDHRLDEPYVMLEKSETLEDFKAAIQALPLEDRKILAMRVEEKKTLKEIAAALGISRSKARRRLQEIGDRLARQVKDLPVHFDSLELEHQAAT